MFERQFTPAIQLVDLEPQRDDFRAEVLAGLHQPRKELPCKFLYDERGAQLFDQICELDEYYPTRTEFGIMRASIGEMAAMVGPHCCLVEYGSGSSTKSRMLLGALREPATYIPIDISRVQLLEAATANAEIYPNLEVLPVCADYTEHLTLPVSRYPAARRVVYFPGSTIGNFHPREAQGFLERIAAIGGQRGALLIGVDLKKDPVRLHRAYNDRKGVTAAFNLNLLARINRELGADFQLDQFRHYAFYNPHHGRIEMHLASLRDQRVRLDGCELSFATGETIWTESSYKYTLDEFARLAHAAGFDVRHVWTDREHLFSVQYLTVRGSA
jgi:dimethylhistidine N-methyltransferase